MTAINFLDELRRMGFSLALEGDRLKVMPKKAITPGLRETIKTYKPQLLVLLKEKEAIPETVKAHNARARLMLDRFYVQVVLPQLSSLHQAGKLPNQAECSLWIQAENEWDKASKNSQMPCDIEAVKKAMLQAIEVYKKGSDQVNLF